MDKNKKGKIIKNKFLKKNSEIILILVSEKIITNKPIKKVKILILEQFKFSFDVKVNKSGTKTNNGI